MATFMTGGDTCLYVVYPLFVIAAIGWVVVKFRHLRRARHWPSAPGKVLANGVTAHRKKYGEPGYNFHDTEVTHDPWVEYEYQVAGETYRSHRFTIGERTAEHELESILENHPVGATGTVYYDPADPKFAVLERDIPWWVFFVMMTLSSSSSF